MKTALGLLLGLLLAVSVKGQSRADVTTQGAQILYQGRTLHPGCFRLLSTQLNGDDTNLVVNVEIERPDKKFIGRGCMSANALSQSTFDRSEYLTYAYSKDALEKAKKDPLFRFDGFGYKLKKKIKENVYAVDIREFTAGSNDFLATLIVEVSDHTLVKVNPKGDITEGRVVSLRKLGTLLHGVVSFEQKIRELLKKQEQFRSKSALDKSLEI